MALTRTASQRMLAQEEATSCGVACVRQLLRDRGIEVSEGEVRAASSTTRGSLTTVRELTSALNTLFERARRVERFKGGSVDVDDAWSKLLKRAPFLALVKRPAGKHWVIVDAEDSDGSVCLRDPAPSSSMPGCGHEETMSWTEFNEQWTSAIHAAVFRDP